MSLVALWVTKDMGVRRRPPMADQGVTDAGRSARDPRGFVPIHGPLLPDLPPTRRLMGDHSLPGSPISREATAHLRRGQRRQPARAPAPPRTAPTRQPAPGASFNRRRPPRTTPEPSAAPPPPSPSAAR